MKNKMHQIKLLGIFMFMDIGLLITQIIKNAVASS